MWIRSVFSAVASPPRAQWLVGLLAATVVGGVAFYVTRPQPPTQTLTDSRSPDPLSSAEIRTILVPDAIPAVDNPHFVVSGNSGVRDNQHVIGVELGGEAHAYPIGFMSRVEIVNDRLGGKNIAVTW